MICSPVEDISSLNLDTHTHTDDFKQLQSQLLTYNIPLCHSFPLTKMTMSIKIQRRAILNSELTTKPKPNPSRHYKNVCLRRWKNIKL